MISQRVLVAGEMLIDFIPDEAGGLEEVESFSRRAGGAPANVAVGLARLEETPWFWTRVGGDQFGDLLVDTLASNGVPTRFVERDSSAKTSLAFVAHDEAGSPEFSFYRDCTADTRLQSGTVPDSVLTGVEWVCVGGVPFSTEPSRTAMFELIERAQEENCTVVFDPNARPELWTNFEYTDSLKQILADVDVVKTTPGDVRDAGVDVEQLEGLAAELLDLGPHTVFVTEGSDGSHAFSRSDAPWGRQSAFHTGYEPDVVDTTGAGDAFTAAVLAALADGQRDFTRVLEFANAVAAAATTAKGAMTALPNRGEVEQFRESDSP